jgi:hypothetical protein
MSRPRASRRCQAERWGRHFHRQRHLRRRPSWMKSTVIGGPGCRRHRRRQGWRRELHPPGRPWRARAVRRGSRWRPAVCFRRRLHRADRHCHSRLGAARTPPLQQYRESRWRPCRFPGPAARLRPRSCRFHRQCLPAASPSAPARRRARRKRRRPPRSGPCLKQHRRDKCEPGERSTCLRGSIATQGRRMEPSGHT